MNREYKDLSWLAENHRLLLATVLLTLTVSVVSAQSVVTGKVAAGNELLPGASISLHDISSARTVISACDSSGVFRMESVLYGTYRLVATMIGYETFTKDSVIVTGELVDLGTITLTNRVTNLNEVVVQAAKPVVEVRADRTVISVSGSLTSSGNTVLDILRKSPGVIINRQGGAISIHGRSGARFMINDKEVPMSSDVLIQMLEGMSAANVDRIEIITTPGANRDAEGAAGIIHIVTRKTEEHGTNGMVTTTLGKHWAETTGTGFSITQRKESFAWSVDYSYLRDHNLHVLGIRRSRDEQPFAGTVEVDDERENVTTQQNINLGVEWQADEKTMFTLVVSGYRRDWRMESLTRDVNHATASSTVLTLMEVAEKNVWQNISVAAGLRRRIRDHSWISVGADYLFYHNDNPSFYNYTTFHDKVIVPSQLSLEKRTPIDVAVGRMDYQYIPKDAFKVEAGLKIVSSGLSNNVLVDRLEGEAWIADPRYSSTAQLDEFIGALYISGEWKLPEWQVTSGLRYEFTDTQMKTEGHLSRRQYGYLFPSIVLKRSIAKTHSVDFSYSRRITRPTYNDIASYAIFWGASTFVAGNTALWPSIADAVSTGLQAGDLRVSFQYTWTRNAIVTLQPSVDATTNALTYRSENLDMLRTAAINGFYSCQLFRWWSIQSNATGQYVAARTGWHPAKKEFSIVGINILLTNVLMLPRKYSLEISGYYQSPALTGITSFLSQGWLNAGIQKKFGGKSTLRLAVDDIFNTDRWRIRAARGSDQDVRFDYAWNNRFIRLSYTLILGNHTLKSLSRKTGSDDERKRVN